MSPPEFQAGQLKGCILLFRVLVCLKNYMGERGSEFAAESRSREPDIISWGRSLEHAL